MASLAELNAWPAERAGKELARCCGSRSWVQGMLDRRPFPDAPALFQAADDLWWSLEPEAWLEAFSEHPRIGGKDALREKFAATSGWALGEQAGVNGASEALLEGLAGGNKAYEEKFGHVFIVCATGKTAGQMLALLNARLSNSPDDERRLAAGEQCKITRIRLEKLLAQGDL